MHGQFTASITYYLQEGRANLRQTIEIALNAAKVRGIEKLLIFTAKGEGIRVAYDHIQADLAKFPEIQIVAVTFPNGMLFLDENREPITIDISEENRILLKQENISLVRAHLPFAPIPPLIQGSWRFSK